MALKPRAYTQAEVQEQFMHHLWKLVRYWETVEDVSGPFNDFEPKKKTTANRLEGLAFGFLSMLDGSSADVPAFELSPCTDPGDEEYLRGEGENWWSNGTTVHGGDQLHEMFHAFGRKHGYLKDAVEPPKSVKYRSCIDIGTD